MLLKYCKKLKAKVCYHSDDTLDSNFDALGSKYFSPNIVLSSFHSQLSVWLVLKEGTTASNN